MQPNDQPGSQSANTPTPPDMPQPLPPQAFVPSYGDPATAPTPQPTVVAPDFPAPQPATPKLDNYEFIMNSPKPTRGNPLVGGSTKIRIAVAAGGIILLLIVFTVIKSLLGIGSDKSFPSLVSVTQEQQAITQITTSGTQNAVSQSSKNFAVTAQITIASEQQQLLSYLKTNNHKVSPKTLSLKVSKATTAQLTAAATASTFDSTFTSVMQSHLTSYATALKAAYTADPGPKGRALLSADYKAVQLLNKQLTAVPTN